MQQPLIYGFLTGAATTAAVLLSYAKLRGLKLLPRAMEDIKFFLGNISLLEAGEIFALAAKYAKGGFTPEEAQALGKKIIEAAAEK